MVPVSPTAVWKRPHAIEPAGDPRVLTAGGRCPGLTCGVGIADGGGGEPYTRAGGLSRPIYRGDRGPRSLYDGATVNQGCVWTQQGSAIEARSRPPWAFWLSSPFTGGRRSVRRGGSSEATFGSSSR